MFLQFFFLKPSAKGLLEGYVCFRIYENERDRG